MNIDYRAIRRSLASLDASASHTASGESRPKVEEIFAPEQHAGALDPNVTIVLGSRGTGKSFWAGVLGDDATRRAASGAYPHIGLQNVLVQFGFTGLANDGSIERPTIDRQVVVGQETSRGGLLWRCVVLRALQAALNPKAKKPRISTLMEEYEDPEEWEEAFSAADRKLAQRRKKLVVVFDALDSIAIEWNRLRALTDALLEVAWSIRGYKSVRAKLFLRPDQMKDLGLRYVEIPKLLAGATNLRWTGTDLYGVLFARLATNSHDNGRAFIELLSDEGISPPSRDLKRLRAWPLSYDRAAQARVFTRLAGAYMGRSHKKGRTYDWPVRHLADGHEEVTPRSFLTLAIEAARSSQQVYDQAITAEGIRHGLREASKTRVNQLDLEFPWIKRALVPLARLQVPCTADVIKLRWRETDTLPAIRRQANEREFLPPFDPRTKRADDDQLIATLVRIGVLVVRTDSRFDMPDLFRVAARLLKKGGVAPSA